MNAARKLVQKRRIMGIIEKAYNQNSSGGTEAVEKYLDGLVSSKEINDAQKMMITEIVVNGRGLVIK